MYQDVIIYFSKNGTTSETVEKIKQVAHNQVDTFDLTKGTILNLNQYDRVFIGCGVVAGNLPSKIVKFVKEHSSTLKSKKVIFFIHGVISDLQYREIVGNAVNRYIPADNYDIYYLGGKLDFSKQNFLVKKILLMVAKQNHFDPYNANTLNEKKISEFLQCFAAK